MEMRIDHFPQLGKRGSHWKPEGYLRFIDMKIVDPLTKAEVTEEGKVGAA